MKITVRNKDKEIIYDGDNATEVRYHLSNIKDLITTITENLNRLK